MKRRVYLFECPNCKEEIHWREENDPPLNCIFCDKKMPIKIMRLPKWESGKKWGRDKYSKNIDELIKGAFKKNFGNEWELIYNKFIAEKPSFNKLANFLSNRGDK
jgi:hypothetical protein